MDSCSQHILLSDTSIVEVCVAGEQLVAHIRGGVVGKDSFGSCLDSSKW